MKIPCVIVGLFVGLARIVRTPFRLNYASTKYIQYKVRAFYLLSLFNPFPALCRRRAVASFACHIRSSRGEDVADACTRVITIYSANCAFTSMMAYPPRRAVACSKSFIFAKKSAKKKQDSRQRRRGGGALRPREICVREILYLRMCSTVVYFYLTGLYCWRVYIMRLGRPLKLLTFLVSFFCIDFLFYGLCKYVISRENSL